MPTPSTLPLTLGLLLAIASCSSTPKPIADARLRSWGEVRDVLRDGKTQARVNLSKVVRKGIWGVGALADLEGEITVLDGKASLAIVKDGELTHRTLSNRDAATLLVLAEVRAWDEQPMIEARTLEDLERVIASAVERSVFRGVNSPVPVRIEGALDELAIHVINHSCPKANPQGPKPWRWKGPVEQATLVGIFGEGLGGKLTHHGQRVHLHAVFESEDGQRLSGHVDAVSLGEGVRLYLPAMER